LNSQKYADSRMDAFIKGDQKKVFAGVTLWTYG